jgi:hypothetical protein
MKKILMSLIALFLLEKFSNKAEVIESKDLSKIVVTISTVEQKPDSTIVVINNRDSINAVLRALNNCSKEPIDFYPTHRIRIIYSNGPASWIYCNSSAMKYDGITYRLDKKIEDIVK